MVADAAAFPLPATRAEAVGCSHCGLPVPDDWLRAGAAEQFCCAGCRSVFYILRDAGLGDYYLRRSAAGEQGQRAKVTDKNYAEYDEAAFQESYCKALDSGFYAVDLYLEGIHCAACVWLVEKLPQLLEGVVESRLDYGQAVVRLVWDPRQTALSKAATLLDSLGYPPHPRRAANLEEAERRQDRALLARVGVAGAAAGNAMLFAIALYAGAFDGMAKEHVDLFRWGSLVATVPAVFWSALVFFRGAAAAVRTRTPHMDVPITIGILAGTASGIVNTVRAQGEIYFDSIGVLIFLLLVGRYLERRQRRTVDGLATSLIALLTPSSARVVANGAVHDVPIASVAEGALVEIRAGERVPVDGIVVEGASSIDRSVLTGESLPVEVTIGSNVNAGSTNLASRLVVRTEQAGSNTRLSKLVSAIEDVSKRRPPISRLLDRIAGFFILGVIAVATMTVAIWISLDSTQAIPNAVAVLIVTCPCALGLGAPLAVTIALGRAAKRGLLVKGGPPVESLAKRGLIVFDKTGTLTEGRLRVMAYEGPSEARAWARSVEELSTHPIARAICAAFADSAPCTVSDFRENVGGGVEATIDGHHLQIGSAAFLKDRNCVDARAMARADDFAKRGWTPILLAVDGNVVGVLGLGDPIRTDAHAVLSTLVEHGYRLAVVSGDHPRVVGTVVREIGVPFAEVRGAATPEQKLAYVEAARRAGPVFMIGDGVNDAGALSAATVGIAVHGGAEASLAAADVFTTRGGLEPVLEVFEGSRRTMRVIRRCLGFSVTYNLAGATLAIAGLVSPLVAAVLMPLSSLTVVSLAFHSRTFGAKETS